MTTFNGERYLREQLNSILLQSLRPAELIVGDDGSTDSTLDIVEEFATRAPFPVTLIGNPQRLGFADNFLNVASLCKSTVVAFCDQDDIWMPSKLSVMVDALNKHGSLLAIHQLCLISATGEDLGIFADQGIRADRLIPPLTSDPYNTGWGNSMVFRKEVLDFLPRQTRPRQPEGSGLLSHDHWILSLSAALGSITHVAQELVAYRQHEANTFGTSKPSLLQRILWALHVPIRRYEERAKFYRELAVRFAERATDPGFDYRGPAAKAAEIYLQRANRVELRIRLFRTKSFLKRVPIFFRLVAFPVDGSLRSSALARSLAKDFLLSLIGAGKLSLGGKH